ncbi:substrate-binding periplasmic protein [Thalassolituus sp. LLYu03]|uniref:substrate-binding periplasmic protein n=1 Tax=Thalassolituus sp. LLYu03 TaxID=3421656 RepID=UPI003D2BEC80
MRLSALLCCICLSLPATARELVVGVENLDYQPIYYTQNGQYQGFAHELLDAFAKASGHTLVYRPLPVRRLFSDFFTGAVDLKYPDNPMWSQDERTGKAVKYSDVTLVAVDGVMVKTDRPKGQALKRLVIIRGFTPWVYQDAIKAGTISVQEVNDLESALRSVLLGRADGAYGNVVVARDKLKQIGSPDALVFDRELPYANSDFMLSSIKAPEIIDEFNAFLKSQAATISKMKQASAVEAN